MNFVLQRPDADRFWFRIVTVSHCLCLNALFGLPNNEVQCIEEAHHQS